VSEPAPNPYAPPAASLAARDRVSEAPVAFALTVFHRHRLWLLIALLWFPANLAAEYAAALDGSGDVVADVAGMTIVGLLLNPLCVAIVIEASRRVAADEPSTFAELLATARRSWRRVFGASFTCSVLIVLGLLALIVPGLVLFVRYAFAEIAAMREGLGFVAARQRSRALVEGRGWPVAALLFGFLGAGLAGSLAQSAALWFLPALEHPVPAALIYTAFDWIHLLSFAALACVYDQAVASEAPSTA
jgi:hypothetical protein